MSPFIRSYFILFMVFSTGYISVCTFAAPVSDTQSPYDKFIEYLVQSNCSMPSVVKLPFPEPSDKAPFGYLSKPLRECQTSDALKDTDEAKTLCKEIFEVLDNITCAEYKTPLSEIQSEPLSGDVCKDFKIKQIDFPSKNEYLSWRLVDPVLCQILCAPGKYDLLCKTLLWSHNLQVKIKNALENSQGDSVLKASDKDEKSSPSIKVNLVTNVTEPLKQKSNDSKAGTGIEGNVQTSEDTTTTKKEAFKLNNLEKSSSNNKTLVVEAADKHESLSVDNQTGNSSKVIDTTKTPTGKELKPNNKDLQDGQSNENLQGNPENQKQSVIQAGMEPTNENVNPVDSHPGTDVQASNVASEVEDAKSTVVDNQKPSTGTQGAVKNPLAGNNIDSSATKVSENKNEENSGEDKQKTKSTSNAIKPNGADDNIRSNENAVPQDTEMENELNNVNLDGQENESKGKESNTKSTEDGNKAEKPVLTDFESPIGLGSETEAKPTESTTLELLPDKGEEEHQAEKDSDQYNDTENEEYPKSDYENSFDPSLKNKDVDIKSSDLESPNQIASNYDTFIRSRNNNGRIPDEGPLISAFPEQEDSHFFFYFLSLVLILMAGYLIFHNKQKIIALIVEGRHERRRRSHGSGYKKLETK